MSNAVEQELVRATGFDVTRKYKSRIDYLAALIRAVSELSDEDFDVMTDEAKEWSNAAAKSLKNKKKIKDFEGYAPESTEGVHTLEVQHETEVPSVEVEGKSKPKKEAKAKKEPSSEAVPSGSTNGSPEKAVRSKSPDRLDRFGVLLGSKSAKAVEMLQVGASMKEVKTALGDTYYNLLRNLQAKGHTVIKSGAYFKLIHKDDIDTGQADNYKNPIEQIPIVEPTLDELLPTPELRGAYNEVA